jgi:hypothetical protein
MDKLIYDISYDLDGHCLVDIWDEHYKVQLVLDKTELGNFRERLNAIEALMEKHEVILGGEVK